MTWPSSIRSSQRPVAKLPDNTVVDGELVALDEDDRPSFNLCRTMGTLQARSYSSSSICWCFSWRDLKHETLATRRALLEKKVMPKLADPIRLSPALEGSMKELVASVKENGLEGLVAKQKDSIYQPGLRTGLWRKMRVNVGQEFVIGGYTPSAKNFDAMVIGFYEGRKLLYSARVRNGFTPVTREKVF